MKKSLALLLMVAFCLSLFNYEIQSQTKKKAKIQVALILDTSNSMDGLIDQAKSQLWKVVNELALARYEGVTPVLEIALYEYGNDAIPEEKGYIRLVSNLTTDLDKISEDLFALKTLGGSEYCGHVIQNATNQLKWSKSNENLKMIFIAGNEKFTQGKVDYKKACKAAIKKGIIVNTIFCGEYGFGVKTKWKDGAELADGKYINIDQDQKLAYIESPFDDEIIGLNSKLNKTYIGYGGLGTANSIRQSTQDANAISVNKGVSVARAKSKISHNYINTSWDLVDALEDKDFKLDEVPDEDLPEEMKKMTKAEKKKYIEGKKKERKIIQGKIKALDKKREKYVADQRKEREFRQA